MPFCIFLCGYQEYPFYDIKSHQNLTNKQAVIECFTCMPRPGGAEGQPIPRRFLKPENSGIEGESTPQTPDSNKARIQQLREADAKKGPKTRNSYTNSWITEKKQTSNIPTEDTVVGKELQKKGREKT